MIETLNFAIQLIAAGAISILLDKATKEKELA